MLCREKQMKTEIVQFLASLRVNYGLEGSVSGSFFGREVCCDFCINTDSDNKATTGQIETLEQFLIKKELFFSEAEKTLVERTDQLSASHSFSLSEIFIHINAESQRRIVCFLFDADMEPELGVAIRFVNEVVDHFGVQDDVL
jgi:hypothetical protein